MNYSNVPVHKSRFRQAGRLSAFRMTVILAAVVLAAPFATAVNPIDNIHPTGDTPPPSSIDSSEIAAMKQRVADLKRQLSALMAQMRTLKDQEPQDPVSRGNEEARKKYQSAHAAWQRQVDKVQQQIVSVNQLLAQAQHQLQALQLKAGQSGH
jgi:hypothetical protein